MIQNSLRLLATAASAALILFVAQANAEDRAPDFHLLDRPTSLSLAQPAQVMAPPIPGMPQPTQGTGLVALMQSNLHDMVTDEGVGQQIAQCTTVTQEGNLEDQPVGQISMCYQTLVLHDRGRIMMHGPVNRSNFHDNDAQQTLAIIGGTGEFVGASGETITYESEIAENIHVFEVYLQKE